MKTFLRLSKVLATVGKSKSYVYEEINHDRFPKPVKIGRTSVWVDSEIQDWIESRIADRDGGSCEAEGGRGSCEAQ